MLKSHLSVHMLVLQLGLAFLCSDSASFLWTDECAEPGYGVVLWNCISEANRTLLDTTLACPTMIVLVGWFPVPTSFSPKYGLSMKRSPNTFWVKCSPIQLCLFWELILILYKFQIFTVMLLVELWVGTIQVMSLIWLPLLIKVNL